MRAHARENPPNFRAARPRDPTRVLSPRQLPTDHDYTVPKPSHLPPILSSALRPLGWARLHPKSRSAARNMMLDRVSPQLEGQPQTKLHQARKIALREDLAEAATADRTIRGAEIRRVEGVQPFEAELRLEPLVDREVLEQGYIPVGESRAAEADGAADIAKS